MANAEQHFAMRSLLYLCLRKQIANRNFFPAKIPIDRHYFAIYASNNLQSFEFNLFKVCEEKVVRRVAQRIRHSLEDTCTCKRWRTCNGRLRIPLSISSLFEADGNLWLGFVLQTHAAQHVHCFVWTVFSADTRTILLRVFGALPLPLTTHSAVATADVDAKHSISI